MKCLTFTQLKRTERIFNKSAIHLYESIFYQFILDDLKASKKLDIYQENKIIVISDREL